MLKKFEVYGLNGELAKYNVYSLLLFNTITRNTNIR